MNGANNLYQLNRAITSGAEKNIFQLPKGPSGKVKLAPKRPKAVAEEEEETQTKEVSCTNTSGGMFGQQNFRMLSPLARKKPRCLKRPRLRLSLRRKLIRRRLNLK